MKNLNKSEFNIINYYIQLELQNETIKKINKRFELLPELQFGKTNNLVSHLLTFKTLLENSIYN